MSSQLFNQPSIIIAAISSRPYVQMALRAGYKVIAIDLFADADTRAMAEAVYQVSVIDGAFDSISLLNIIDNIDLSRVEGFCYGAGFESQPRLLDEIARRLPVFGNNHAAVMSCKNPMSFFDFCESKSFCHPQVCFHAPLASDGWLAKQIGQSGGAHIQFVNDHARYRSNYYFQQFQQGRPISCLFLSNGKQIAVIGFNEQWVHPSHNAPFRYGGAVSHIVLANHIQAQMIDFVSQAVNTWCLFGLNSCDAILHEDTLYFLEINPRLSATASLYNCIEGDLFLAHIAACKREPIQNFVVSLEASANVVKYATVDTVITDVNDWPEWVSDIPIPGKIIQGNMPICTITSTADDMLSAKALVKARAESFNLSAI